MKNLLLFLSFILINNYQMEAQNPDYTDMIKYAVKAPSGHNTQPWLFKINDNSIEIHPNMEKALPVVDSNNRELFVSLGCATENLCIAASEKGYKSDISVSPKGIITVYLEKENQISKNPLFDQIALRQTNRSVYNNTIIADDTINILNDVCTEKGVSIHFYKNGTPDYDTITGYILKGNIIQMQDKAFKDELKSWMRFNKKHQDETNDGLSYAVFGAPNLPEFIAKPIISKAINAKSQNKGDIKKIKSSSHFILITCKDNTVEDWIYAGIVLERISLEMTRLNIIHAYCNQPNEIEKLSRKMSESLNLNNEIPVLLLRAGYGKRMPYSVRKDIRDVIIE